MCGGKATWGMSWGGHGVAQHKGHCTGGRQGYQFPCRISKAPESNLISALRHFALLRLSGHGFQCLDILEQFDPAVNACFALRL